MSQNTIGAHGAIFHMQAPGSVVLFWVTPESMSLDLSLTSLLPLVSLLALSLLPLVSLLLRPRGNSLPLGSWNLPGLASLLYLGKSVVKEHTPVLFAYGLEGLKFGSLNNQTKKIILYAVHVMRGTTR